jgi:hypothetical protein
MSNYYVSDCCNSPTDLGDTCNYCHQKCKFIAMIDTPGGVPKVETITVTNKNISMLRQWLNEDRIDDCNKLVTNEDLLYWLNIK